jgi:transposase
VEEHRSPALLGENKVGLDQADRLSGPEATEVHRREQPDETPAASTPVAAATGHRRQEIAGLFRVGDNDRFSVNAMSAISTRGRMHFMVFAGVFDAKVMCRFLDRLTWHFDREVHLIVGRHSAHRSKAVRAWLVDRKYRIELHFLPSYSPELNPDELVNADLERSLPHTHRARSQTEPAAETRRFLHGRQRQPHVVIGCFKAPHVRCILDAWTP